MGLQTTFRLFASSFENDTHSADAKSPAYKFVALATPVLQHSDVSIGDLVAALNYQLLRPVYFHELPVHLAEDVVLRGLRRSKVHDKRSFSLSYLRRRMDHAL